MSPTTATGSRTWRGWLGGSTRLNQHVGNGKKLPKLDWSFVEKQRQAAFEGHERQSADAHAGVDRNQQSPRDFREAQFVAKPMTADGDAYFFDMPVPESGCAALLGEAVFNGDRVPYYLSTNVRIVGKAADPPSRKETEK